MLRFLLLPARGLNYLTKGNICFPLLKELCKLKLAKICCKCSWLQSLGLYHIMKWSLVPTSIHLHAELQHICISVCKPFPSVFNQWLGSQICSNDVLLIFLEQITSTSLDDSSVSAHDKLSTKKVSSPRMFHCSLQYVSAIMQVTSSQNF